MVLKKITHFFSHYGYSVYHPLELDPLKTKDQNDPPSSPSLQGEIVTKAKSSQAAAIFMFSDNVPPS